MFAVLDVWDYLFIAAVVALFAGGGAAYARYRTVSTARLARLERKVDAIMKHFTIEYTDPAGAGLSDDVKRLADDPATKIEAIKRHREQTGLGLKEAKDAVEAYIKANS